MYKMGDLVVYEGSSSICEISRIDRFDFQGGDRDRLYYVLKPLREDCVIYNPVDNTSARMRPVLTRDEAERLIDTIPDLAPAEPQAEGHPAQEAKQMAQHFESIIRTRDCARLLELTMSLYDKQRRQAACARAISPTEAAAKKRAEEMLFDELSIALGIPAEGVQKYIEARLDGKTGKVLQ
jgi:Transcriptional regulators, similar to M. xanthus CarD